MKVQILDSKALKNLLPSNCTAYLKSRSAELTGHYRDRAGIWNLNGKQLLLPLSTSLDDYASAIAKLLMQLEEIESRDQLAIYRDIANSSYDIIRVKNSSEDVSDDTMSIERSVEFVSHTKDMMAAIACSVANNKLYHTGKKPNAAEKFMKQLRFGQTERGSFVLTLLSPVTPELRMEQGNLIEMPDEDPYEKRVVPSLQTALEALNNAGQESLEKETINPFIDGASKGISANLCDAVVGLHETSESGHIEIKISYALNRNKQYISRPVVFNKDYISYFKSASTKIKSIEPIAEHVIRGPIIGAKRKNGEPGIIVIQDIDYGRTGRTVSVMLPDTEYEKAVTVHRDRGLVEVSGTLAKYSGSYRILNPDNIQFIESQWKAAEE